MYGLALLLHILAATIWTGGHIVLSVVVLPKVLRERSPARLLEFESVYEKIGMPALIIQVITGLFLAYRMLPDVSQWLDFSNPIAHPILLKLSLLTLTLCFAMSARFRVIWLITSCRSANNIMPITVFLPAFIASFFYSA